MYAISITKLVKLRMLSQYLYAISTTDLPACMLSQYAGKGVFCGSEYIYTTPGWQRFLPPLAPQWYAIGTYLAHTGAHCSLFVLLLLTLPIYLLADTRQQYGYSIGRSNLLDIIIVISNSIIIGGLKSFEVVGLSCCWLALLLF